MSTPTGGNLGDATITVNANTSPALLALNGLSRDAQGRLRDIRGRFTSEGRLINGTLTTVTANTNRFSDAVEGLRGASLLLSPALIPIAAQAAPIAAGLGAAAVAVGAFAAAAAGQVSAITEAGEAEKKYKEAVDEHGATSAKAAEAQAAYAKQVAQMPAATRTTAAAVSVLKDRYQEWSDALASNTMPVATKGIQAFTSVFPKLTPLVKGTSTELNRFVTIAAGGLASPGFDRFMNSFSDFAVGSLAKANDALVRFTRTLNTGKVSGGVSEFMEYARANAPLVRETLSRVAEALSNILVAASNVGPGLLTVVNALAGIAASLPPDVITSLLQMALALKAVRLAAAGMAAISGGVAAFTAAVSGMQAAAAGATGILPRLAAAIGSLSRATKIAVAGTGIGLLVVALSELSQGSKAAPPDVDKLTSSLKRLGAEGKATGEAAKHFGKDLDGLYGKVRSLTDPSTTDNIQQFIVTLGGLGSWDSTPVKDAKENLNAIDDALAGLVKNGQADLAANALKRLTAEYGKGGRDTEEFTSRLDGYKEALADAKFEQQLAADAMGLFGQQAQDTSAKLAEQKMSADGLRQSIQALNDVNRAALGGMIGFEASIDAAAKAAKENAGSLNVVNGVLDLNSPKAQAAATALSNLAQKTDEAAAANRESTGSWSGAIQIYERGRQQLVSTAQQMGLTKTEAEQLASQILKTPNKTAMLKADITDWKSKISEADKQLKSAKGEKKAKLTADVADWRLKVALAERQLLGAKASKQAKLTADIGVWQAKVKQAETQLKTAKGSKKATLTANIQDLQRKVRKAKEDLATVRSKSVTITAHYTPAKRSDGLTFLGASGRLATGGLVRYARGGRIPGFPSGGPITGPGTGTSDSILARVSNGEFVVNAKATAQHLPLLEAINSGKFSAAAGMAGGGLAGAGAAAGDGLAAGIGAATRGVEAAARAMAAAVVTAVRTELQISSPSRKTRALAKDVGAGFISGLTGSKAKIKSVSADLAKDIRAAFSGRKESNLLKMVNRETKDLLTLAGKRDAISKKIADANKFATDTASKARATGSLASIVQEDAYSPKYVKGQMQASLNQIKAFTASVKKLQAKGVNKDLIRQILEMGPEQGGAFAKSLAGADKATIKQYNSLNANINKESSKLGKLGADLLYDSGKHAGKGFLTGLKAQQKDIEKLMLSIAKGMQKAIKKALGIKSPSTVFAAIGRNIGDGLVSGMAASHPKVSEAAKRIGAAAAGNARTISARATAKASRPRSGYAAAVAELQRLVDSGKWGGRLFEDVSFQGMSKNYQREQMKVADGFWAAVSEIKKAVRSGKNVFEDMTFKGMSANVRRFHDMIAQIWKGNPYSRTFGNWGKFGTYGQYGKYARGGPIVGPGTSTSDSIPILASRDEFMMRAAAVRYYGRPTMAALNSMRIPRGALASMPVRGGDGASSGDIHHHYHVTLDNRGVIGSQMELDNWLAKSLARLKTQRRLPSTAGM
ncbi:hypothetical protein F8R89_31055 [Streptomyces sp. SS1-1]|uniref:hypothetical protein n=1 Tax=Streptomyces sp. SS1-1 TaxID=2651869 RepID=UPI00124FCFC8|nr:hypothetical protein [Streptomyces sp. SS1-1]KAB2976046.1 hypothetical protein F8R89_31055 [Streptomyces sp. SS1-1]